MSAAQKSECPAATGQNANQNTNQVDFGTGIVCGIGAFVRKAVLAQGVETVHRILDCHFLDCRCQSCTFAMDGSLRLDTQKECRAQETHPRSAAIQKQLLLDIFLSEMPGNPCVSKSASIDVHMADVCIANFTAIGDRHVPGVFEVVGVE